MSEQLKSVAKLLHFIWFKLTGVSHPFTEKWIWSVKVRRPTRGFPHEFSITASLPVKCHQKSEVTCDLLFIKPLGKSQGYLCKPDSHSVAFSESFLGGRKGLLLCVPESETSLWISFLTHDTGRKISRDLLAFYSYIMTQNISPVWDSIFLS